MKRNVFRVLAPGAEDDRARTLLTAPASQGAVHMPPSSPITLRRRGPLPPTILCAAHTVEGAGGNGSDFLPLQPLHLPRSSHVVVGSVAQPVIVAFAPAHEETRNPGVQGHVTHHRAPPAWHSPPDKSHVDHKGQVMTTWLRTRCKQCRIWLGRRRTGTHTPPSPHRGL